MILRACAVLDLADVLDEELARIDSSSLLGRVALPVQRVLADMETTGIAVDTTLLSGDGHTDLVKSTAADGRIHTTFEQTSTSTGRLSSTHPDLHDLGTAGRTAFVAGDGYVALMCAGYRDLGRSLGVQFFGESAIVEEARKAGYAATVLGRRRYLPDLDSRDARARAVAERAAVEMAIQGSAADIINLAIRDVGQVLAAVGLTSRLVAVVDDELVFEVADGERDTLVEYVSDQMVAAHELVVPLEVWIGHGSSWGALAVSG